MSTITTPVPLRPGRSTGPVGLSPKSAPVKEKVVVYVPGPECSTIGGPVPTIVKTDPKKTPSDPQSTFEYWMEPMVAVPPPKKSLPDTKPSTPKVSPGRQGHPSSTCQGVTMVSRDPAAVKPFPDSVNAPVPDPPKISISPLVTVVPNDCKEQRQTLTKQNTKRIIRGRHILDVLSTPTSFDCWLRCVFMVTSFGHGLWRRSRPSGRRVVVCANSRSLSFGDRCCPKNSPRSAPSRVIQHSICCQPPAFGRSGPDCPAPAATCPAATCSRAKCTPPAPRHSWASVAPALP